MRRSWSMAGLLTILLIGGSITVSADPIPSWENTNPSVLTLYWAYNFDDGILFSPTITLEGGNSSVPTDPLWDYSGSGDLPSIMSGALGLHNATENSQMDIYIKIPNGYDAGNIKTFWFAYDVIGTGAIVPTAGTTNLNHTVSGISYSTNTIGNHIEAYVTIDPQPQNEWLNLNLSVATGETIAIDNLTIGSSCIPEPSSVILLAIGGVALIKARKKAHR